MRLAAWGALLIGLSIARPGAAQEGAAREAVVRIERETLRIAIGSGFSLMAGPSLEVNGDAQGGYRSQSGIVPVPSLLARADHPLGKLVLLGLQGSFIYWRMPTDDNFGASGHFLFDLSALVRLRWVPGVNDSEILLTIPIGPTFDTSDLGARTFGGELHEEVGWHTGFAITYQQLPPETWCGFFGEVGFTWHYVSKSVEYETGSDELLYQPEDFFIRGGLLLLLFR